VAALGVEKYTSGENSGSFSLSQLMHPDDQYDAPDSMEGIETVHTLYNLGFLLPGFPANVQKI
jgi:hypothetical protein